MNLEQWFLTFSLPCLPQVYTCPLFQAPLAIKVAKANVLFGKFIEQTSNVVQHLRASTPRESY